MSMRLYIILFVLLISKSVLAQEKIELKDSKHKIGFNIGIGKNNGLAFTNIDIDRDYEIYLFQFEYHRNLIARKLWAIEALAQPQINFATFENSNSNNDTTNAIEFGVNVGLLFRLNLFKDYFSIYSLIGSGPHFINKTPDRQSSGFIFSDNFFMGANVRVSNDIFLDIRSGKRHASNLNIGSRNGGINTFFIHLGIVKLL